jgi:hypothetical protein
LYFLFQEHLQSDFLLALGHEHPDGASHVSFEQALGKFDQTQLPGQLSEGISTLA